MKNAIRPFELRNADLDRSKAADLVLGWHRALFPRVCFAARPVVDEAEALALRIFEIKCQPAVPLDDSTVRHLAILEAFHPPLQRGLTADAQSGANDTVGASLLRDSRPIEKSQVCAGLPFPSA